MARYTKESLLESGIDAETVKAAEFCGLMCEPGPSFIVWAWRDAPEELRKLCCLNGGDEDWLVLTEKEPAYVPSWVEHLDTCVDPDVYVLDRVVLYVGSHA